MMIPNYATLNLQKYNTKENWVYEILKTQGIETYFSKVEYICGPQRIIFSGWLDNNKNFYVSFNNELLNEIYQVRESHSKFRTDPYRPVSIQINAYKIHDGMMECSHNVKLQFITKNQLLIDQECEQWKKIKYLPKTS